MTALTEATITRGAISTTIPGWVAPAFTNVAGEQPARAYFENVARDALQIGDTLAADGFTYIVTRVGWWPPDSIEAVLAGVDLADTCTIERASGGVLDPVNHQSTTVWSPWWSGACAVRVVAGDKMETVGAERTAVLHVEILLPMAAPAPKVGHRITITNAHSDPALTGQAFFVSGPVGSHHGLRLVLAQHAQKADR
jgi:hypothetical protein